MDSLCMEMGLPAGALPVELPGQPRQQQGQQQPQQRQPTQEPNARQKKQQKRSKSHGQDVVGKALSEMEGIKERRGRDLQKLRSQHANKEYFAPLEIETGLKNLSFAMREESKEMERIKTLLAKEGRNIYVPKDLPEGYDRETAYPKHYQLDSETKKYGKYSDEAHSYSHAARAPHVLAIWYKQKMFNENQLRQLEELKGGVGCRLKMLFRHIDKFKNADFRPLRLPYFDWDGAKVPDENLKQMTGAALLHYDMSIPSLVLYCGGRHRGEHRRIEESLFWLKHILQPDTFAKFEQAMMGGNPARFICHQEDGYEQFKAYKGLGNLNLHEDPALVQKQLAKEQARQHSLLLPSWMAVFIPNLSLIPMGIVLEEDKKPRVFRHASLKANKNSRPVNDIVKPKESEPEIEYAHRLTELVEQIFDLRQLNPQTRIILLDTDTSGAFNHLLFHLSAISANGSLVGDTLIVTTGLHFGGNFGPADFEAIALTKMELAKYLFYNCKYQRELNKELTDSLEVDLPARSEPLAQAMPREISTQENLINGEPNIDFLQYVDDELVAAPEDIEGGVERLGSSSAEATYLALSYYPGNVWKPVLPPAIASDKLEGRPVGPQREMIGFIPDTDDMVLRLPQRRLDKLERLIVEGWPRTKQFFHAKEAAKLLGQMQSCAFACSWFKLLALRIHRLVKEGLKACYQKLNKDEEAKKNAAKRLKANPKRFNISKGEANLLKFSQHAAKLLWAAKAHVRTTKVIFEELDWVLEIIREHRKDNFTWSRPMSHIVREFETARAWQDASLEYGIGGFCPKLNYYFSIPWEKISSTIRETFLNAGGKEHALGLTSINICESIAELVQYAAQITAYRDPQYALPCPPKVHNFGDNTSANAWADGKAKDPSAMTRRICKLRMSLARESQVGSKHTYINTNENWFADRLSRESAEACRTYLSDLPKHELSHLIAPFQIEGNSEQTMFLRNFRPSQQLLSLICTALWNNEEVLFPKVKLSDLGHFEAGRSSSITLSWRS
jgi:hypothetical protein